MRVDCRPSRCSRQITRRLKPLQNRSVISCALTWHKTGALTLLLSLQLTTVVYSQSTEERLYYRNLSFGSEAYFSPLSFILNDAFDILQVGTHDRDLRNRDYRIDAKNLWNNISALFKSIRKYGTRNFISQEIFPLNFHLETAQWGPNYLLHVIGGGIAYRTLWEYYDSHGFSHPGPYDLCDNRR